MYTRLVMFCLISHIVNTTFAGEAFMDSIFKLFNYLSIGMNMAIQFLQKRRQVIQKLEVVIYKIVSFIVFYQRS